VVFILKKLGEVAA